MTFRRCRTWRRWQCSICNSIWRRRNRFDRSRTGPHRRWSSLLMLVLHMYPHFHATARALHRSISKLYHNKRVNLAVTWSDHVNVIEQKLHYACRQSISTFMSLQRFPSHCQSSPAVYCCLSFPAPVARSLQRPSDLHVALRSNTHRSTYF